MQPTRVNIKSFQCAQCLLYLLLWSPFLRGLRDDAAPFMWAALLPALQMIMITLLFCI